MKRENLILDCVCGGTGHLRRLDGGFAVACSCAPGYYRPTVYLTERKAIHAWNQMQKNMDNLARDAMVAEHRGISYGNYIPIKGQVPHEAPKTIPAVQGQEKRQFCVICGGEIPKAAPYRRKYCSGECADIALNQQRKAADCRRRAAHAHR